MLSIILVIAGIVLLIWRKRIAQLISSIVLGVQGIELLVQPVLGGDPGIDCAADRFDRSWLHDRASPMANRSSLSKGDVTPVYSITPSTVASNLEGSFRPNVLAVLSRRFSLSVPYWLPWTIVHLQRGGADDEDDFGTNPK